MTTPGDWDWLGSVEIFRLRLCSLLDDVCVVGGVLLVNEIKGLIKLGGRCANRL